MSTNSQLIQLLVLRNNQSLEKTGIRSGMFGELEIDLQGAW
jgi:hypothetical protein